MPAWGTEETLGLTERMALRVLAKAEWAKKTRSKGAISVQDVITAGLGEHTFRRPDWFPKNSALEQYDDDWENWEPGELKTVQWRIECGVNANLVFNVFNVPRAIAAKINDEVFGKKENLSRLRVDKTERTGTKSVTSSVDEKYDLGEFNISDIEDQLDRRFANRRWTEYGTRVDLEKPANETTIRLMIIYEVELRKAIRELNDDDDKVKEKARARMSSIRAEFSKAAADTAQLEKQFKLEPEHETLDSVIERSQDIRKNWRNMDIENQMALRNLYDLVEQFHRTHLDGKEAADGEETALPDVKPRTPGKYMPSDVAARVIERSDKGQEMVIDG